MRKYINILGIVIIALSIASCGNSLEEDFKTLDELEEARLEDELINGSISGEVELTLTDDDYAAIDPTKDDDNIEKFKNFGSIDEALEKLPAYLKTEYPTFKDNSTALVTFNYFNPSNSVRERIVYEVTTEDYNAEGGNIERFGNFSADAQVLTFLSNKYPDAQVGTLVTLTYKFFSGGLETLTNSFLFSRGQQWEAPLTLSSEDYTALGQSFSNFSDEEVAERRIGIYLKDAKPFAFEGDIQLVLYTLTFFEEGSRMFEDQLLSYTFDSNQWNVTPSLLSETVNFSLKNRVWKPSTVIKYEFVSADYDAVATALSDDTDLTDEVGNLDRFGNFNRGDRDTSWDDAELVKAFNVVLKEKFPDAEAEQEFLITISTFNGASVDETLSVVLAENGDYTIIPAL